MSIEELKKIYKETIDKGIEVGLTKEDYIVLKKARDTIFTEDVVVSSKWSEIYYNYEKIINYIFSSGLIHQFSEQDCEYIMVNSILLPLVLANNGDNKIKMQSDNSYMFLCQFHHENTPSFGVTDWRNLAHCFGCGVGVNVITYLEEYERLSFKDVIKLLSKIYLFDIKCDISPKLDELAKKYQKAILSQQYLDLLLMGKERYRKRGNPCDTLFEERYNVIERIKNGKYDSEFKSVKPKKKMYISKEEYNRYENFYI